MTANRTEEKLLKKQQIRNSEYYNLQHEWDKLHAQARNKRNFKDLMGTITDRNNILLAYRNIKNNSGSRTKGTDGKTISHYKEMPEIEFVRYIQDKFKNYAPKSVLRVEIPKAGQPHKKRPLGIPCMDDRIIQQCIFQVLEPIVEAYFHKHSYGFRPNRATSHAISRSKYLINMVSLHYVVDIDIKGFFDNVNHGKLLKQLWALGIQDKNLISIVGRILKSEIKGIGTPTKGTPQGGIISPLLSNIVLNELDWWLSGQWEDFITQTKYSHKQSERRVLKTNSNLKEFYFVRYADDFKIFCRDYKTAQKIFIATKLWLKERLDLEVNNNKSKITNVRKGKTEFLGLTLYAKPSRGKYTARSNISERAIQAMIRKLKDQIKTIQKETTATQVNKLNAIILGFHNYYKMATLCSFDFGKIGFIVNKSLKNRLGKHSKLVRNKSSPNQEPRRSLLYKKLYGSYKSKPISIANISIFPIHGCKFKISVSFSQEINKYTESGRQLIHNNLYNLQSTIQFLLNCKEYEKSVEYNDNRISLIAGQNGKCGVTGETLQPYSMECHHKRPKHLGGNDDYDNLLWILPEVHKLIHASEQKTINKYLKLLKLDKKALNKVNSLRLLAENLEIKAVI